MYGIVLLSVSAEADRVDAAEQAVDIADDIAALELQFSQDAIAQKEETVSRDLFFQLG